MLGAVIETENSGLAFIIRLHDCGSFGRYLVCR